MQLMAQGEPAAMQVVATLGLSAYYEFFRAKSTSHSLPYHNAYHARCMLLNCYEGSWHAGPVLDSEVRQALVLGAIFHDADHSGGLAPDTTNIERAVDLLWVAHAYCMAEGVAVNASVIIGAVACIRATQYPHVEAPKNGAAKIIRDADLMQVYENNETVLLAQYRGLQNEIGKGLGRELSNDEFSKTCGKFIFETEWHTDWAREKARVLNLTHRSERLQRLLAEMPDKG